MDSQLKKTPLYDRHVVFGGKMIDFGGWSLPVGRGRLGLSLRVDGRHPDGGQGTHTSPNHSCLLHHGDCSLTHAG